MEELDYKTLFHDAVNMMAHIARAAGFDPDDPTVEPPAIVARVENQRADLATARRLLPPRYVAADGSILDPERCTPHASDCAECGRGRAHDEGCLALLATPAEVAVGLRAEVERLTAVIEEARLTLAAEQGRAEGAPSEGWTYGIIDDEGGRGWRKPWPNGMIFAWGVGCYVSSSAVVTPHPGGWSRWRHDDDGELDEEVEHHTDEAWSTRAAMLAADAFK